jgi:hypothetical protein
LLGAVALAEQGLIRSGVDRCREILAALLQGVIRVREAADGRAEPHVVHRVRADLDRCPAAPRRRMRRARSAPRQPCPTRAALRPTRCRKAPAVSWLTNLSGVPSHSSQRPVASSACARTAR